MIDWPEEIIEDISSRRCVLYLGGGVSMNSTDASGNRPPDWKTFLENALPKMTNKKGIKKQITEKDYLTACEMIKLNLGDNTYYEYAKDNFLRPRYSAHNIHETIYKLDSKIIMTTNVDKIYETFALTESKGTVVTKSYHDHDLPRLIRGRISDRLIIKAHGTIDTPDKMVFTRSEYASARINNSQFYRVLDALILSHTFIFLGSGFSDPDIQLILENYNFQFPNCRPHYMLTGENVSDVFKQVYEKNYNVEIIKYSAKDNHKELHESLTDLLSKVEKHRQDIAKQKIW